ncbi:lipoprotein signal peptidase [Mucilaginibacter rubeus]|uniref:Lipoprotein signal peptidase n=1 Tax=Mucilaginibacter rubeus TaxID=2027860 RepID=A0AAE6MKD6_9SPHI|nr:MULTISPECIES: lipoprotein signal peptidase [Mucilaginibacter]QEM06561.1 lipoprotein signal peptidase [Mucilaginibacter rubeus]QEM19150.1 lipoprotein signal peptidase [Mucilaginibacter gossypii]QTE44307.1 lipoprotein signal peptidase [Mucilaginibacter rubeus]QTE50907.1 lipoprotein signal peptidase [Mucilaginibacter rubeus]QTE55990.1 lipoprotein signal peptidase [Mucilaginibacter rubeus]
MKAAYTKPFLTAAFIILADQIIKTWVRAHMQLQDEIRFLGSRGMLHYTENNGMAFGMEWGGDAGKLALTLFRIVAVCGIIYTLIYLIKHKYHRGLIMNVALILAGAMGNIIDSTFYGIMYKYAPLFHGRVVDMFYFPLLRGTYPSWFPFWAGESFEFFRPVFNLADASICVGVIMILLYQKRYFKHEKPEIASPNSEMVEE